MSGHTPWSEIKGIADLRRRAEQAIGHHQLNGIDPQTILALLDRLEDAERRAHYQHYYSKALPLERRVAALEDANDEQARMLAERRERLTALEEGLRALSDSLDDAPFPLGYKIQEAKHAARALLDPAPSEPPTSDKCPACGYEDEHAEWCPTALPAEVGE